MVGTHRPNMKLPTAATRVCLSCDKPFSSEGPWNRICGTCNGRHDRTHVRVTATGRLPARRKGRFHSDEIGAHDWNGW